MEEHKQRLFLSDAIIQRTLPISHRYLDFRKKMLLVSEKQKQQFTISPRILQTQEEREHGVGWVCVCLRCHWWWLTSSEMAQRARISLSTLCNVHEFPGQQSKSAWLLQWGSERSCKYYRSVFSLQVMLPHQCLRIILLCICASSDRLQT